MRIGQLARRLDLPADRLPRLFTFLALAISLFAAHALVRTVAEALFLVNAGAQSLPLYFLILFLAAAPAGAGIARLIDRVPRAVLVRRSLTGAAVFVVGLRFVALAGGKPAMFVVLVGVVLVEMLVAMQFWVLLSDYFTVLEQKRVVPALTLALAAGGALGGTLANALVRLLPPADVLLALVPLYGVAFWLVARLQRTAAPLQGSESEADTGFIATLRALPQLAREYPVVGLLAAVGFLDVLLGGLGSYLSYVIYARSFPSEREMTAFLGVLKAVMSVAQVVLIYFVTRPLVQRFGAGRLNLVYPATTFASLSLLAGSASLPAAVAAHVNFDTVTSGVNSPVENLTYNAVPPRFLGRVRALSEGILQPSGLAAGGLLLALVQHRWSFRQLALFTLGLSAVHVLLGWWRGREYGRALATQLAARSIDLFSQDEVAAGAAAELGAGYAQEIEQLLAHEDPEARAIGLELAARLAPHRYVDRLATLAPRLDERGRDAAVHLLATAGGRAGRGARRRAQLESESDALRALGLEAAAARAETIPPASLNAAFLAGPHSGAAAWAACASVALSTPDGFIPGREGANAVLRLAARRREPRLVPALLRAVAEDDPTIRRRALESLARLAPSGGTEVGAAARAHLEDAHPEVRGAAYLLLGREDPAALVRVAQGLEDPHGAVRRRAAEALGAAGPAGLPALTAALAHSRSDVVRAALRGLGRNGSNRAAEVVLEYLRQDFADIEQLGSVLSTISVADASWQPLALAIHDFNRRTIDRVLLVLESFGHERTLRHARVALGAKDPRWRANAVEALAALPQRRFVAPVMRLLETLAGAAPSRGDERGDAVNLEPLLLHRDRWIRASTATVAHRLGRPAADSSEDETMSRLLFLKQVPLFSDLTFDHLLAIDGALRRADYLSGETVCEEGSVGEDFYIISKGEIAVRVGRGEAAREVARLGPGEFFGEMALFDDEPRSATCVVTQPATLLVLDRQRFYSLLEQAPRLGVEICRMLSLRLRRAARAADPAQPAHPRT